MKILVVMQPACSSNSGKKRQGSPTPTCWLTRSATLRDHTSVNKVKEWFRVTSKWNPKSLYACPCMHASTWTRAHTTQRHKYTLKWAKKKESSRLTKRFLTCFCIEIPPFTHLKFLRHVKSNGSFFLFTSLPATKFFAACKTIALKAEKKTSQTGGTCL